MAAATISGPLDDWAAAFGISPATVSQLRLELQRSWLAMHGELAVA